MTIPNAEPKTNSGAPMVISIKCNSREKPAPLSETRSNKRGKKLFKKRREKENASKLPLLKRGQKSSQNTTQ